LKKNLCLLFFQLKLLFEILLKDFREKARFEKANNFPLFKQTISIKNLRKIQNYFFNFIFLQNNKFSQSYQALIFNQGFSSTGLKINHLTSEEKIMSILLES